MDHVDWLEQGDIDTLCAALRDQVKVIKKKSNSTSQKMPDSHQIASPESISLARHCPTTYMFCHSAVQPGGRVIWRSASRSPKYADCIEKAGFDGKAPNNQLS